MRGAKAMDGKRVYLLVELTTRAGVVFLAGETGIFCKRGVVRCSFTTDDGRTVEVGHRHAEDFQVVAETPKP